MCDVCVCVCVCVCMCGVGSVKGLVCAEGEMVHVCVCVCVVLCLWRDVVKIVTNTS